LEGLDECSRKSFFFHSKKFFPALNRSWIQLPSATDEWSPKNTWFGVFIPRNFRGWLFLQRHWSEDVHELL